MAAKSPINIIAGAGNIGDSRIDKTVRYDTPDQVIAYLEAFYKRGYKQIDTARNYSTGAAGTSEPRLGAVEAGKRFIIDTKVKSREPGSHTREKIAEDVDTSLKELRIDQINIEYLHQPDRATPFEETCEAIDKAYREGKFKKFGLSNFTAGEVAQVLDICERRGFVKPSVYQGQYNPLVRGGEKELFSLLRKNNMAFYAWRYVVATISGCLKELQRHERVREDPEDHGILIHEISPAGGGFFAGNYKTDKEGGRFDKSTFLGSFYSALYLKPSIEAATEKALAVSGKHSISGHAAALRWTVYHSGLDAKYGDAIIVGASTIDQVNSNLDIAEAGPLPDDAAIAFEALYKEVGADEIPYAF